MQQTDPQDMYEIVRDLAMSPASVPKMIALRERAREIIHGSIEVTMEYKVGDMITRDYGEARRLSDGFGYFSRQVYRTKWTHTLPDD